MTNKWKTVSGIYSKDGHIKSYTSTDFFVDVNGIRTKFNTQVLARAIANKLNRVLGEVICIPVKVVTYAEVDRHGNILVEEINEFEDNPVVLNLHLIHGVQHD